MKKTVSPSLPRFTISLVPFTNNEDMIDRRDGEQEG